MPTTVTPPAQTQPTGGTTYLPEREQGASTSRWRGCTIPAGQPDPQPPDSRSDITIIATSGGTFGEPRDTYFECGLPDGVSRYPALTKPIDSLVVEGARCIHPKVLCITTGSDPRLHNIPELGAALVERFKHAGAGAVEMMAITYYAPDDDEMRAAIESADVIYVSGGTSQLLNATLRRRGADWLLWRAAQRGTVLSGLSAGLCCWFSHVNSAVSTEGDVITTRGLGWFEALVAPHWDLEPKRHKPFHQTLLDNPGLVGLAFDEHTAIEIRGDKYRLHSFGPAASCAAATSAQRPATTSPRRSPSPTTSPR